MVRLLSIIEVIKKMMVKGRDSCDMKKVHEKVVNL